MKLIVELIEKNLEQVRAERERLLAAASTLGLEVEAPRRKAPRKTGTAKTGGTAKRKRESVTASKVAGSSPEAGSVPGQKKEAEPDAGAKKDQSGRGKQGASPSEESGKESAAKPEKDAKPSMIEESDVIGPARPDRVEFSYESLEGEPVSFTPISEESALMTPWPDHEESARQVLVDIIYSRPGTSISELSFYLNTTNFYLKDPLAKLVEEGIFREQANLYFPKRPGKPAKSK